MSRPFVSVLIDTYNHERFIEQAVVSALEQDFPSAEREILVVDDGSTDGTAEIVRKFEPRVRLLRKANGGQASAFNAGIPECRGGIVAFLDGDDWWEQGKLSTILCVFGENPDVGAVGHGFLVVDASGKLMSTVIPEKAYRLDIRSPDGARRFSQLRGFLGTSKVAYRKALLDRILPIPEGAVIEADEFLFTLAVCLADAIVLDQPLFYYRFHEGNLFMIQQADKRRLRRKYESLACLLQNLPAKMETFQTPQEIIDAVLAPLALEVEMHRLQIEGGSRWEMMRAERAAYQLAYSETPLGYRIFKHLVLGLILVVPPQQFIRMKQWYSTMGLRNLRRWIGEPTPAAPVKVQR